MRTECGGGNADINRTGSIKKAYNRKADIRSGHGLKTTLYGHIKATIIGLQADDIIRTEYGLTKERT